MICNIFIKFRYVVFELMQTDLHTIIKNKNEPLPEEKYKFLLYQILRGLKYIHSAKIVHRDLVSFENYLETEKFVDKCKC